MLTILNLCKCLWKPIGMFLVVAALGFLGIGIIGFIICVIGG